MGITSKRPRVKWPAILCRIEITLTAEENAAFQKSAAAVRELVEKLKL